MGYKKAFEVLPVEIIDQIQNYVDGKSIYIPKREERKKSWGENTDTRLILSMRNADIYQDYHNGMTIQELSQKYFLVDKSIQRIIRQEKNKKP